MLAAAGLNTRLFVGGNNELILLQCAALPLARVPVQDAARLGSEVWITGKDPTAALPGRMASSRSQRHGVLPLTEATNPLCWTC
jgi:hypothetical protein